MPKVWENVLIAIYSVQMLFLVAQMKFFGVQYKFFGVQGKKFDCAVQTIAANFWVRSTNFATLWHKFLPPYSAGVAKVRPAGHMRPSQDFLRPLCQILVASLSYLWPIYVRKRPKIDINYVKKIQNLAKKEFLRPAIQYLNAIFPVVKKVWPPLL